MAHRSFGSSWQAPHPPRYAALLRPSSPRFPHSSHLYTSRANSGRLELEAVGALRKIEGERSKIVTLDWLSTHACGAGTDTPLKRTQALPLQAIDRIPIGMALRDHRPA